MGETKTQGGGGFVPRDRPGIDVCTECGAETTDWWIRGLGCQTCAPDLDYTTARALSPPEDEEHCACTPHLRRYALRLREERATLRAEVARLQHFRDEMCDGFDVPRDTSLEDLDAHISTVLRTALDTLKERDAEVARLTREVERLKEANARLEDRRGTRWLAERADVVSRWGAAWKRAAKEMRANWRFADQLHADAGDAIEHLAAESQRLTKEVEEARDARSAAFEIMRGAQASAHESGFREMDLLGEVSRLTRERDEARDGEGRMALGYGEAIVGAYRRGVADSAWVVWWFRRKHTDRDRALRQTDDALAIQHGTIASILTGVHDAVAALASSTPQEQAPTKQCEDCGPHECDCPHCVVCGAGVRFGSRCHAHPAAGPDAVDDDGTPQAPTGKQGEGDGGLVLCANCEHSAEPMYDGVCQASRYMDGGDPSPCADFTPTEQPEASEECTCFGIHVPGDTECPAYVDTSELLREWEAQLEATPTGEQGEGGDDE